MGLLADAAVGAAFGAAGGALGALVGGAAGGAIGGGARGALAGSGQAARALLPQTGTAVRAFGPKALASFVRGSSANMKLERAALGRFARTKQAGLIGRDIARGALSVKNFPTSLKDSIAPALVVKIVSSSGVRAALRQRPRRGCGPGQRLLPRDFPWSRTPKGLPDRTT